MRRFLITSLAFIVVALSGVGIAAVDTDQGGPPTAQGQTRAGRLPSIADRTDGLQRLDGFFPLHWDEATGSLYLEIPRLDTEILYVTGLGAGMGSNDIGIDRAQLAAT